MSRKMSRKKGFTLIEFMIAAVVTLVILGAAVGAFLDSNRANQQVSLGANMDDNLRAAVNLVRQDIVIAGEGIPKSGILIPSGPNISVNRPGPTNTTFPQAFLPAITLGTGLGPTVPVLDSSSSPTTGGGPTDEITLIYSDNTLGLDQQPIFLAPGPNVKQPCPNGQIATDASFIVFDSNCLDLSKAKFTLNPGDLIMFQNPKGTAIQTVTSVSGQKVSFVNNNTIDKFGLNQTNAGAGTLIQMQNPDTTYPPATASRVWMVSYYLDNTTDPDPRHVRLVRQVNFGQPQPVAEVVEALNFRYNFFDNSDPTVPPKFYPGVTVIPTGLNENNIRAVDLFLGVRSDNAVQPNHKYLRDNLQTQIAVRGLNYFNRYQ